MKIKLADISDLESVSELLQGQFREHGIPWEPVQLRQAITGILNDRRWGQFLLAWQGDKATGLAAIAYAWTLEHGGKSAWLDELYVIPELRGQGVGSALLENVIEVARQQGCLALDLEVEDEHQRAEHLYERMGFAPLPRRRWVKHL